MAEEQTQRSDWVVIKRLWSYLQTDWLSLVGVLFALILVAVGQGGAPALIGVAIDQFIGTDDSAGLARTMLLLIVVYVVGMVGFAIQLFLMGQVSQRLMRSMRMDIFNHVQRLDLGFYTHGRTGDLMSRLVNDTDTLAQLFSQSLAQALGSLFGLVGIIIGMISLNLQLSVVSLVIIPLMFLTTRYFSAKAREAYRETREALGHLSSHLQEDMGAVREAQAFSRTGSIVEHFAEDNMVNRDANVRASLITAAFSPSIDVLSTVALALIAGIGGYLAIEDIVTVGIVVAFIAYAERFYRPIQQLSGLYTQMQSALAAGERVFDLLDTDPSIQDKRDAEEMPPIAGKVEFENVYFGYDDETPVLKDVNVSVEPGQTIALVGPTGAGKSTFVNLVPRFYDADAGRVLVDDIDIRDVTRSSFREQIGVVPQDAFLFSTTLLDNIRYGKPGASLDEVIEAAKAAQAHDFISELPERYETKIGERGANLSQGQRQLISIARVILSEPRLLILDEATSNIDTKTERLIQKAIDNLLEGRTAFVIAHRLSTIENADVILVLEDGHIIEQGDHVSLLAQDGLYATLYEKQQVTA